MYKKHYLLGLLLITALLLSPLMGTQAKPMSNNKTLESKTPKFESQTYQQTPTLNIETSNDLGISKDLEKMIQQTPGATIPEEKIAPALRGDQQEILQNVRFVTDGFGHKRIFILFKGTSADFNTLTSMSAIEISWIAPLAGGNLLISAKLIDETKLYDIAKIDGVRYIAPDFYIYDIKKEFDETSITTLTYGDMSPLMVSINEQDRLDGDASRIAIDAYKAVQIEGATQVWDLGYTGSGVTIAIVDTGVDYGVPNLNTSFVVQNNNVLAFVPDGDGVAFTPYIMTPYNKSNQWFLPTAGKTFVIIDGFLGFMFTITFTDDFNVTNVKAQNLNDVYHFGVFLEWLPTPIGFIVGFPVPVLVTDSNNDGIYDRVYVDLTGVLYMYAYYFGLPYEDSWMDMIFEGPYYVDPLAPEKALIAIDVYTYNVTGGYIELGPDGYDDFSLGVIGVPFMDTVGVLAAGLSYFGIIAPVQADGLDPNGNWVGFMYDFHGHGTSCASTAAGRRVPFLFEFINDTTARWLNVSGLAPDATVMGVRALSWGYVVEGWFYSAGFDLTPFSYVGYQVWNYTGAHKADVISNSWGISWVWAEYGGSMFAYDVISLVETSLSLPGMYWGTISFTDPYYAFYEAANIMSYEPSLFVHAEGNGGPGYGTANTGPWSPLAIQVAASTSWHWRPVYSIEPAGTYDQMVWWSGRGPVVSGLGGPDVAAIGAYAFETVPLSRVGVGSLAWSLFGGTSQATPMTAGAAALVIDAFMSGPFAGMGWSPIWIKTALMLSADDLGYDLFTQGLGRINAYKAVLLALNTTTGDIGYLSDEVFEFAAYTIGYSTMMGYNIYDIGLPYLFMGYVYPGDTLNYTLTAISYLGDADPITNVEAKFLRLTGTQDVSFWLDPAYANYTSGYGSYFWFNTTTFGIDLKGHDFVRIVYHTPDWFYTPVMYTAAWLINDYNGDGNVTRDEVRLINRFTGLGPVFTVEIAKPYQFADHIGIGAFGYFFAPMWLNFTILYYDYVSMPTVTPILPSNATDHDNITVTLSVPSNALPGTYWGYLFISTTETTIRIPLLYHVIARVNTGTTLTYTGNFTTDNSTYPNYSWLQGYDIFWRGEVGEWRVFYFETNASALVVMNVTWNDPMTDAYIHIFDMTTGQLIYREYPYYIGAGWFFDRDPYGATTSAVFPVLGNTLYAIVIRAPVLGGAVFPVNFAITFTVYPRTGPFVTTLDYYNVATLDNPAYWAGTVASPEGLYSIMFLIDGSISVAPDIWYLDVDGIFEYYEFYFTFAMITEGVHEFSIGFMDWYGYITWFNFTVYIDRTEPLLYDATFNGTSLFLINSSPPVFNTPATMYFTVTIMDVTPSMGFIYLYNAPGTFYVSYMWLFDYESGVFSYVDAGLNASAYYDSGRGMWILMFSFEVYSYEILDGWYFLDIYIYDMATWGAGYSFTVALFDLNPPEIMYTDLYSIIPPTIVYSTVDYIDSSIGVAYHSVYLEAGEVYRVYLEWTNPNTDLDLEVYDPYGGYVDGSYNWFDTPEEILFYADYTGFYTIEVLFFSGDPTDYYLEVSTGGEMFPISYIDENVSVAMLDVMIYDPTLVYLDITLHGSPLPYMLNYYGYGFYLLTIVFNTTNTSLLTEGLNEINITAMDAYGRTLVYIYELWVDTLPPYANLFVPNVITGAVNITFTYGDYGLGVAYVELYLDGYYYMDVTGLTSIEFNSTMYSDGMHIFELVVVDFAGHVYETYAIFYIDNTPPEVSILTPEDGAVIGSSTFTANWTGSDAAGIDHYEISLDGTTWTNVGLNTSYTFTGVSDGEYTIYVKAIDIAGFTTTATVSIIVDTANPVATLELPEGDQTGTFTINITVDDANFESATLYIDGAPVWSVTLPGSHQLTLNASQFADGEHEVVLVVKDKAGKETKATGTLKTEFYGEHEREAVKKKEKEERSRATVNMAITGVVGLVVGAIVGVVVVGRARRGF